MKKLLSFVLCLTTIFGFLVSGIATPIAEAASFSPRLTEPTYDTYYKPESSYNPFAVNYSAYGGNCTWYAWGRAYEITGTYPNLGRGNAGTWWNYNKNGGYYSYGSTPKLGAVACWSNSSAGHVAVVEQINADGSFVVSESGWSSCYFRTVTIPASGSRSGLTFQGFIYLGDYSSEKPNITSVVTNVDGSVTLSWNKCSNASYYSIRFFKVGETSEYKFLSWVTADTTYTYELPDGTYTAYITAESSGGWSHGDMCSSFSVERKAPSKPQITNISTNNGFVTLSWTPSDKTRCYSVRFFKAGESSEYLFLQNVTTETNYTYELPDGSYTATVTAEGDYWTHSDMSSIFTIEHQKPSKPNIKYIHSNNDGTVTIEWEACENTNYYDIRFFEYGKSEEFAFIMGATTETTFTYALPDGKYTTYVTAVNNYGWTHGDMSTAFFSENRKPSQPVVTDVITKGDGSVYLEWTPCSNTKSYSIRFFEAGKTEEYLFLQGITTKTSYTYKLPIGSYTAYVTAEAGDCWTHSDMTGVFDIYITNYSVKYNSNGGTNTPSNQTKTYNMDLILSSVIPNRNGYTFLGWSKSSDATDVDYYVGDIYSENADVTLYAVWELDHTHNYTSSVTKQPTCMDKGIREYTCFSCGDTYTEDIAALGHSHVISGITEPTCYESGFTTYDCTRCDNSYNTDFTDALNHPSSSWVTVVNPTADSNGLAEKHCDYCGYVSEQFVIPALVPDYVTGISLSSQKETVEIGDQFTLTATVKPDTAKNQNVVWSSRNPEIATVANGKVTAVKPGTTAIVATTEDGGYVDFCLVRVLSLSSFNGAVVNSDSNMVYGLSCNLNSIDDYLEPADGSMSIVLSSSVVGTGTTISVIENGEVVDSYTAVIFGDIDGNGWYDANDAFLVRMLEVGLLTREAVGEAVYKAADCNHDGVVDGLDVQLLERASILLDNVNQSATRADLVLDSVYIEYCSVIDQSAGFVAEDNTAVETQPEPETKLDIVAIFSFIFSLFEKIFTFVISIIG